MKVAHVIWIAILLIPHTLLAAEGVLYLSPEYGSYEVGEIFEVRVLADTDDEKINAAEAELTFNPAALEVVSLSTDNSILASWSTSPAFSNDSGSIRFAGWAKENYAGSDGLLITVTFKALRTLSSHAQLAAGAILAADGRGSNIITSMKSGLYTVEPKQIPAQEPSQAEASTTELVVPVPPKPPQFIEYADSVEVGDRILVKGTTEANAKVSIVLKYGEDPEVRTELMSASDGSFTYVSDEIKEEGVYRIWGEVTNANELRSEVSDRIAITARPAGMMAVAASGALLLEAALPFLAILVIGGLFAGYIFHRHAVAKMRHKGHH